MTQNDKPWWLNEPDLRDVLEALTDAILVHELDSGAIVYANRRACELYGYTLEEVRLLNPAVLSSDQAPYTAQDGIAWMQKALAEGPQTFEWSARTKGGESIPVEVCMRRATIGSKERLLVAVRGISGRVWTKAALQAARNFAQNVIETANAMVVGLDAGGNLTLINAAAEEITGYERQELIGRNWFEILVPRDRYPGVWKEFERLIADGTPQQFENPIITKGGEERYIVWRSRQVHEEGKVVGTLSFGMDITERRRAEEALKKSEEKYRQVVENAMEAIFVAQDGRLKFVNEATTRVLERTSEETTTLPFTEFIHPDDRAMVAERYTRRLMGDELPPVYPFRIVTSQGAVKWVEITAVLIEWAGRPASLNFVSEITDRKRAEERLRESEERFQALFDRSLDLVYVHDFNGRFLDANPVALELFGYEKDEIGSLSFESLLAPDELPKAFQTLKELKETGTQQGQTEFRVQRKNGGHAHVETKASVILRNGQPHAVLGVGRDVTEKRKLQEHLMLSDRMASVGTLAAGVAHEINNPLTAVLANLDFIAHAVSALIREVREQRSGAGAGASNETLIDTVLTRCADIAEPLRETREAADRVRYIVRDLKLFSRSGGEDERGPVDLKRVLESSVRMAWNEIRHRARLVTDYQAMPAVDGSEARLGQVFLNLIVNAAQAIPEGRADQNQIRIACRMQDPGQVVVEVSDTGEGISPENIRHVFDPFFTTKSVGVGTGLGLSICHRIVTAYGGQIEIESEVGKGTTLRVVLRVASESARATSAVASGPPPVRRGRILVVDDELFVGAAMHRILAPAHEVVSATSSREALERLSRGERFDLIICDLMMPHMTGMDLHSALMTVAPSHAEKMIFMTGGAFTPGAREFLDRVPNARIEKPIDPANLRLLVNGILR